MLLVFFLLLLSGFPSSARCCRCDAETKSAFYNLAIYLGKHNLFDQEALTNGDIPAQFMLALDTTYFAKDEDRMQVWC